MTAPSHTLGTGQIAPWAGAPAFAWAAACLAAACSAVPTPSGLEQPIRVKDAQFIEGPLPGSPPPPAGTDAPPPSPPFAGGVEMQNKIVAAGQPEVQIDGKSASPDTVAVGVAFKGAGTGYWLSLPKSLNQLTNHVEWTAYVDFASSAPTGLHDLLFAAVDANGRSGSQASKQVCIVPTVPDWVGNNPLAHNACDPKLPPPATVVSLDWDAPVDLDLEVMTPSGVLIDPKHPVTTPPNADGGAIPADPHAGRFTFDSNSNCIPSNGNLENIVWDEQPPPGTYHVYVNLFDACGAASVNFNLSIHVAEPGDEADTFKVVETFRTSGSLVATEANGGSKIGLFVTDFKVE